MEFDGFTEIGKQKELKVEKTKEILIETNKNSKENKMVVESQKYSNMSENFENTLRPLNFKDYVGQEEIKNDLDVYIQGSKIKGDSIPHILLYGSPGLGKTTLAQIIANERGSKLKITTAKSLEKAGDLVGLVLSLEENDILFIDEIHGLNMQLEETLYSIMEDFRVDIQIEKPNNKSTSIRLPVKRFTLIAATTKQGSLSQPFKERFKIEHQLQPYSEEELALIAERSAKILNCKITKEGLLEIAKRSRSTARLANNYLERLSYYSLVKETTIDKDFAIKCFKAFKIDDIGLSISDKKYLYYLCKELKNKPTGIKSLAQYTLEDEKSLESVTEPFLISKGFLERTSRGRMLTDKGMEYAESLDYSDL